MEEGWELVASEEETGFFPPLACGPYGVTLGIHSSRSSLDLCLLQNYQAPAVGTLATILKNALPSIPVWLAILIIPSETLEGTPLTGTWYAH